MEIVRCSSAKKYI